MKKIAIAFLFVSVCCSTGMGGVAQSSVSANVVSPVTRYFKLTIVLRFPSDAELEPASQTVTTEVAILPNRTGSCKTRMTSQVPIGTGLATKFIDVGTKFDCNDVRLEGNGLALSIVLETNRLNGMVSLKNHDGVETQEPIISQRNLALSIKLPLDTPKVIFKSKNADPSKLKRPTPLGEAAKEGAGKEIPMVQDSPMQVEMTASELK